MPTRRLAAGLAACAVAAAALFLPASMPAAAAADVRTASVIADIAPHRALYRMGLASARNSSKVTDVRGSMVFQWADACDGWTTEQRFQLRFGYAEGDQLEMTTSYATWEAKDGLQYRFNVRKLVNGELDEEVRGEASLKGRGAGGTATFARPEEAVMDLVPGTMFPTAHTISVLEHARRDDRFFPSTVFDGADAEGSTEISSVIGPATKTPAAADNALLRSVDAWPVRMAFFPLASDAATPEYEMAIRLLRNGVVDSMRIDYGDFVIEAVLEKIEALPAPRC